MDIEVHMYGFGTGTRYRYVKNIASMAMMSHKDCGLDYSPMSQMVRSHVKKLANEIDVLDQSEEGLHQRKGNTKNRFSKCDEWDWNLVLV